MGGERRQRSIAVVGVLAAITGLSGVSAATSAGGDRPTFSKTAVASPASASQTTTTTTEEPAAVETTSTSTSTSSSSIPPTSITTTTTAVGIVSGRVIFHDRQPVAGAKVTLVGSPDRVVLTDADGRYRFSGLTPGVYQLELWAESASAPCYPSEPCIGGAVALEEESVTVRSGETTTQDWEYPFDSPPTYSDGSGSTPDSTTTTSSTSTSSTTTTTR